MRCVIFAMVLLSHASFACKLTVRYEAFGDFAAMAQVEGLAGIDVAMMQVLLKEANCSYEMVDIPWGRALQMLASGHIDAMPAVTPNAERKAYMHFVGPQYTEYLMVITQDSLPDITSYDDMLALNKPLAIQVGAYYGREFDSWHKQHQLSVVEVGDTQTRLQLLQNGRISGFIEEKYDILYQIKHNPDYAGLKVHPLVVYQDDVYFAFSKRSVPPERLIVIQQAYEKLKQSGQFKQVMQGYQ